MRYFMPWSTADRRPAGARTAARLLAVAVAAAGLTGCSWITGVPNVARVRVTATPTQIAAKGVGATIVGEAYDNGGGLVNHRRRIVQFRSSDPTIAAVSGAGTGTVLGLKPGVVWIVGESDGKKDSVQITVGPEIPPVIRLNPEFPTVTVGSPTTVAVVALSASGQPIGPFTLGCQSSTPTVMTAQAQGTNCVLTGVAQGQATLLVTVNGAAQNAFNLAVGFETPAKVEPAIRAPLRVGNQLAVVPRLLRADNTVLSNASRSFTCSTSDNAVIAVEGNCTNLVARRAGSATISVTANNVTGTQVVQVTETPIQDLLVPQNPTFRVGAQQVLQVAAVDTANAPTNPFGSARTIQITAADPTVLRVGATTGLVEPLKAGTTQITVRVDSLTRTTTATVTLVPVGSVSVDSTLVERNPGGTFQYSAIVFDSLGRRVTDRPVTWASQNSSVVSVDATTGLARALTPGQVQIIARVPRVPGFPDVIQGGGLFTVFAAPVARVRANPTEVSVARGASVVISLVVEDAAGNQLFNRSVLPASGNAGIAVAGDVTAQAAVIRGVSSGTTTIRFFGLDAAGQPQGTPAEVTVTVP
jgi:hypothetical protein